MCLNACWHIFWNSEIKGLFLNDTIVGIFLYYETATFPNTHCSISLAQEFNMGPLTATFYKYLLCDLQVQAIRMEANLVKVTKTRGVS